MSTQTTELTTQAGEGPIWCNSEQIGNIQRVAKMFASSPLVPQIYQGDKGIGSCVIALNMAHRMGADPLMVMQNLYVVHGRPSWSAQFLIACFNQTGRFDPVRFRMQGEEGTDAWGCRAYTKDLETGEEIQGPLITIALAKAEGWYSKNGSKWKTIPELMLRYRAAAWMIRTTAPEIAMGLPTQEEQYDIGEAKVANVKDIAAKIESLGTQDPTPAHDNFINEDTIPTGDDPDAFPPEETPKKKGKGSLLPEEKEYPLPH